MSRIRQISRSILVGALAYCGLVVAASSAGACVDGGEDDTTTTGKRVTLHTEVVLDGGPSFENSFGWQIELSKLLLSSGALYYFDGHPIESAALSPAPAKPARTDDRTLQNLLLPRNAQAHPGHYDAGEARGEMLSATSFDLVAGPALLGDGEGVTGTVRSARFTYNAPPSGPAAGELGSHVVLLQGSATKDGLTKMFRLSAGREDVLDAADEPVIEGCTFEEVDIQGPGTITLHVAPEEWLDQAEFDDVPDSADGKAVVLGSDHRAARAFVRGLKKSSAFYFSYAPD